MHKDKSRDELFDLLKFGKLTPDEAEVEARRCGLEPLRRVPNVDKFDPTKETQWTLPMAVAWIAYRSREAVRDWWPSYREQYWDWSHRKWRIGFDGDLHEGWFLEQRSPATLSLFLAAASIEPLGWRFCLRFIFRVPGAGGGLCFSTTRFSMSTIIVL